MTPRQRIQRRRLLRRRTGHSGFICMRTLTEQRAENWGGKRRWRQDTRWLAHLDMLCGGQFGALCRARLGMA